MLKWFKLKTNVKTVCYLVLSWQSLGLWGFWNNPNQQFFDSHFFWLNLIFLTKLELGASVLWKFLEYWNQQSTTVISKIQYSPNTSLNFMSNLKLSNMSWVAGQSRSTHSAYFPWNLKASYIFGSALGTVLELPPQGSCICKLAHCMRFFRAYKRRAQSWEAVLCFKVSGKRVRAPVPKHQETKNSASFPGIKNTQNNQSKDWPRLALLLMYKD